MTSNFMIELDRNWIKIINVSNLQFYQINVFFDYRLVASSYTGNSLCLETNYTSFPKHVMVIGYYLQQGVQTLVGEQYYFSTEHIPGYREPERDFKPGDILVASDNVDGLFTGYMGHSALIVDEHNVIESPGGHPAIQKDSIQQFREKHPLHAQFRPKSLERGIAAAKYAEDYLKKYMQNLAQGKQEPKFSLELSQSLEEPWEYIYCSKLIWISYNYGANYKLENDFLWFSPEDLYTNLFANDDFELVYEHEDIEFKINT